MSDTRNDNLTSALANASDRFYSVVNNMISSLQGGSKYGLVIVKLCRLVADELTAQPPMSEKIQKQHLNILISLGTVFTGLTFLSARHSTNVRTNKFADGLCLLLSMLTHLIANNKIIRASQTKNIKNALAIYAMLNVSKKTQLGLRKGIGLLSSKKPEVTPKKKQQVVSSSEELQHFYPSLQEEKNGAKSPTMIKAMAKKILYGRTMFKLCQKVMAEVQLLKPQSLIHQTIDENVLKQYHRIFTSFSSVLTGLTFLLARNSANEQHNTLADGLCIMLSILTHIIINNKLMHASKTNDIKKALAAIVLLNVSRTAQVGARKGIGYLFSEAASVTGKTSEPDLTSEDSLRHFYN